MNESFTYLNDNNVIGIFDSLLLSEAVPYIRHEHLLLSFSSE